MEPQDPRLIVYVVSLLFVACGQTAAIIWFFIRQRDAILETIGRVKTQIEAHLDKVKREVDEDLAATEAKIEGDYNALRASLYAEIAQLINRIDRLEDRATRLEGDVAHLPDKDITHRLELSLNALKTDVAVMSERLKPVTAIAVRLQEAILEKAQAAS